MLLAQVVSAQTIRDRQTPLDSLSVEDIFNFGKQNDAQKGSIKIKAKETIIQRHDGNNVFKADRVVEYTIKKISGNIIISRKIISTKDSLLSAEPAIKKLFPNMTSKLLSGILQSGKRNKTKLEHKKIPCSISSKNGLVSFNIDKLALAGGNIEEKIMGTTTKFSNMTETFLCKEKSEQPSLENIKYIITSIALTSTTKLEGSHHIELVEVINIENMTVISK